MSWVLSHELENGEKVYNFILDDGFYQLSATVGYPELDEYLEQLENEGI